MRSLDIRFSLTGSSSNIRSRAKGSRAISLNPNLKVVQLPWKHLSKSVPMVDIYYLSNGTRTWATRGWGLLSLSGKLYLCDLESSEAVFYLCWIIQERLKSINLNLNSSCNFWFKLVLFVMNRLSRSTLVDSVPLENNFHAIDSVFNNTV